MAASPRTTTVCRALFTPRPFTPRLFTPRLFTALLVPVAEPKHLGGALRQQQRQRRLAPRLCVGLVADVDRLHVDHPAARDGGGRGDGEVVHLEDHVHGGRELDALAVGEAEHLVVVENLQQGQRQTRSPVSRVRLVCAGSQSEQASSLSAV